MPPERVAMRASALLARLANSSSCGMRASDFGVAQTKVAAEDEQVFAGGEIGVEIVELRHNTDLRPRFLGIVAEWHDR
jgi:hypothetical protein